MIISYKDDEYEGIENGEGQVTMEAVTKKRRREKAAEGGAR